MLKKEMVECEISDGETSTDSDITDDQHTSESDDAANDNDSVQVNGSLKRRKVDDTSSKGTKPKKLSKEELYKPPTSGEINNLKEIENLFHSSLFKLQIDELLTEVKLTEKKKNHINEWINELITIIQNVPASKVYDITERTWLKKLKVEMPIDENPFKDKGIFKFISPSSVDVIGSFPLNLSAGQTCNVDVALQMPKGCFQGSDYLNHRYHRKRALYLAYLTGHLKTTNFVSKMKFSYLHGNHMCPVVLLTPPGNLGKRFVVRLMAYPESSVHFKSPRFIPVRNNVRSEWYSQCHQAESKDPPTPHYNAAILRDLNCRVNHEYITSQLSTNTRIRDGIILLKIWLRQRQLDEGIGCFGGFIMTMFVLYLLKKRRINPMMSCYQVARSTWVALSNNEWPIDEGITLADSSKSPDLLEFSKRFDVTFVDPSGFLNLCADVPREKLLRVKHEAELAVQLLGCQHLNSFDSLFMTPIVCNRKFDALLHISNPEQLKDDIDNDKLGDSFLDHCGNYILTIRHKIIKIIRRALGLRVQLVDIMSKPTNMWEIDEKPKCSEDLLKFGLLLDTDHSSNILDKGPQADEPDAVSFREFWGDKSELRRFQDGSICEAVVWNADSVSEKRIVIEQILKYSLSRHLSLKEETVSVTMSQFDSFLNLSNVKLPSNFESYGTGEQTNMAVLHSFDTLSKSLRKLKELPLDINSIQGISPVFRFSEVFPPLPVRYADGIQNLLSRNDSVIFSRDMKKIPKYVHAIEVLIQLEGSGKWPDNVEALRRVKAAFYLRLAKLLDEQCFLKASPTPTHVDVYKDGYVFRLSVSCIKEIVLLKTHVTPDGMTKLQDTDESIGLENKLVTLPKLTSTLNSFQQQYPIFSPAVRLAKRWICSQLLGDHIPDLAIELIVSHLFVHPDPYTVPKSPLVAFYRFLHLLSNHDWKNVPLLVNLNNEFTPEDYTNIQSSFSKMRHTLPPMFISHPLDKQSYVTKRHPIVPILHRLILLTREANVVLDDFLNDPFSDNASLRKLFHPSLNIYDVIINLKSSAIPKHYMKVDGRSSANFSRVPEKDDKIPIVDFDPVSIYIRELEESFGDIALFSYDKLGGDIIGVLWKPSAKTSDKFKATNVDCRIPTTGDGDTVVNFDCVLDDFVNIGRGLVLNVTKHSKQIN